MSEQVQVFSRWMPDWQLPAVEASLKKLNRKAAKLGVPGLSMVSGEPVPMIERMAGGDKVKGLKVEVTISSSPIKLPGFEFLGRLDHEQGLVMVATVPGKVMPEKYRTPDDYCDHCQTKRFRKAYYVFQATEDGKVPAGQTVKVGSTCLKDYMGHNADAVLWAGALSAKLDEEMDGLGSGGGQPVTWISMTLAMGAAVIREKGGYVSKAASQAYAAKAGETGGVLSTTAELTSEHLFAPASAFKPPKRPRYTITEVDRRVAQAAKAWFLKELETKKALSDYDFNLKQVLGLQYVSRKQIGLLVSLVGVYQRAMGQLEERKKQVNAWQGTLGQRRDFTGTYAGQRSFEGQFGTTYYTRVATPEGMVVVKSSTNWWDGDLEVGKVLSFKATIIKHEEYKELKSTVVNRAKFL